MYIKLFTGPAFKREKFAAMLNGLGVTAKAVTDGVILNRNAVNAIPEKALPAWVKMNLDDINSIFHTRPATADEIG